MSKREKLLKRIRNNPKNVSLDTLRSLLALYGIILDRISGSHHIFVVTIEDREFTLSVPFRRPVKAIYIEKALDLIEAIEAAEKEKRHGNEH